tara:strand:- start:1744 stop:3114 length:1371 start_codon:yes stop_codon:yes gene_type:complete
MGWNIGGVSGGGGFTLGPSQNVFTGADKAAAEQARDNYASSNPSWLQFYNDNVSLNIRLEYDNESLEPVAEYQVRNGAGTEWLTNSSTVGVKGNAGSSTNYQFTSESERDNFFANNLDLLIKNTPIVVTFEDFTVVNQVWSGDNNPSTYNSVFWRTASVRSGLSSFEWGDNHTSSSVGENVIWKNNVSDVGYFPAWQGVGDHSTPAGRFVYNRATARVYDYDTSLADNGLKYIETLGPVAPAGSVPYDVNVTLSANEAVFGLKVVPAENYNGRLDYTITRSPSNVESYTQSVDVNLVAGQDFVFWFKFQSELMAGQTFTAKFTKNDGSILNVRPALSSPTNAYVEIRVREFEDEQIPIFKDLGRTYKDSNFTASNGQVFAVNTTSGSVIVDASSDDLVNFGICDSHEKFNNNSCILNFGGGNTFELDTRNDYFMFYRDNNGSWRYVELDQDDAGAV